MPEEDIEAVISEAFRRLNETSRRLRTAEERFELVETNMSSDKDMIIKNQSENSEAIEKLKNQIKNLEDRLIKIENEIVRISKVLEKTAKSVELEELKGMFSLLNPLQSKFVTQEDVKKLLEEKAGK